ncbi:MAG: aconitase/3-isopropylmalate dehydratase large subunit family protein [Candidatus Sumerlaeia bacterium]|nr:aconitase/3-isopropylmalate dehydratase large subunit family protein [Candidatus Sumerlaeia bacterium]
MTMTEKILARAAGRARVAPGENVWVNVDILMTHDVCGPGTFGVFREKFGPQAKVWDPEKVVIIPDHYIFTRDEKALRNIELLRQFAAEQHIRHFYDVGTARYRGVCHVTLPEEGHTRPGEVLLGTDSHTCTAGAFNEFATGIGNTEAGFVLGTGRLWLKVPPTLRYVFDAPLPDYLMAKDLILRILADIGVDGATYCAMEFAGPAVEALDIEERMTLCNMAVEAGGKNGIIAADRKTIEYVRERTQRAGTKTQFEPVDNDVDARFALETIYRSRDIEPMVARPHSPGNGAPARLCRDVKVDQVYIGSCTGGKLADFRAAAQVLAGRTVKIRTLIVPATTHVERMLETERLNGKSLREIFADAGCEIAPPSCAACLGGPADTFGRLKGHEVCISTTNRNFPARMGSKDSQVYLASPLTAAASALTGYITDPRDVL